MHEPEAYSREAIVGFLEDIFGSEELRFADALGLIDRWIERGDGVAVYRNEEIGHPEMGHIKMVSYGSAEAQLPLGPGRSSGLPPSRLPDIGTSINWRYILMGVYRAEETS